MAIHKQSGKETNFIVLLNFIGFTFQWNAYDAYVDCRHVYKLAFFWRQPLPRIWWSFAWNANYGDGSLTYSHGWKGNQVTGWTIRGPLVKFVKENSV